MSKIGDIAIGFVIGVGSVLGLGFWLDKKEKEKAVNSDSSSDVEVEASNVKKDTAKKDEDKENSMNSESF